jgi:hypothetical protein
MQDWVKIQNDIPNEVKINQDIDYSPPLIQHEIQNDNNMGLFKGLFKRKVGGTFLGNLVRGVTNKVSGGVLGNGGMMITQEDADKRDLSEDAYLQKYGITKTGATPIRPILPEIKAQIGAATLGALDGINNYQQSGQTGNSFASGATISKYTQIGKTIGIAIGAILAVLMIIKLVKKK